MMPNFALHLSVDGITLDQRQGSGWVTLGRADFMSSTLAADLADLHAAGFAAADGAFATKLVLPNDQVKFLKLRDGSPSRTSVGMALEGATPYALSELEFDWRVTDGTTQVAAVAKDTLAEAEAFAREHNFEPAAFVCLPQDGWDGTEAFFGPVMGPGAVDVRRDSSPYVRAEAPAPVEEPAVEENEPSAVEPTEVPEASPVDEAILPSVDANEPDPEGVVEAEVADVDTVIDDVPEEPVEDNLVTEESAPRLLGAKAADLAASPTHAPRLTIESSEPVAEAPTRPLVAARSVPDASEPVIAAASLRPARADMGEDAEGGGLAMFRSRRRTKGSEPQAAAPVADAPEERPAPKPAQQTVFDTAAASGARVGGKPRFLGLILTALLIVGLLAVAAFATGLSGDGLSRLFSEQDDTPEVAAIPLEGIGLPENEMIADGAVLDEIIQTPLDPSGDGVAVPGPTVPTISDAELQRTYAATGIWQRAPDAPRLPTGATVDGLYIASIDARIGSQDAVALPMPRIALDTRPSSQPLPAAFGTTFAVDDRGLVIGSEEGVLAPNGYTVFVGRPALTPPLRTPVAPELTETPSRLAEIRPRLRPGGLQEAQERASLGGYTRDELAAIRPRLRPEAAKQAAEAAAQQREQEAVAAALAEAAEAGAPEPEVLPASKYAVAVSARPTARPKNFDKIVESARKSQPGTVEQVAAIAPRTTRPSGPTRASVARAATTTKAINLRRVNLIGVYGKPSNRQALVRLANGRFVKVRVGDRVDGGRVAAIGESQIRYVKGGRNITLDIPS